jgi:hypothetical protein
MTANVKYGALAKEYLGTKLPLTVLRSAAGYYLGTIDDEGPASRESVEYWPSEKMANAAMNDGEWTQRDHP